MKSIRGRNGQEPKGFKREKLFSTWEAARGSWIGKRLTWIHWAFCGRTPSKLDKVPGRFKFKLMWMVEAILGENETSKHLRLSLHSFFHFDSRVHQPWFVSTILLIIYSNPLGKYKCEVAPFYGLWLILNAGMYSSIFWSICDQHPSSCHARCCGSSHDGGSRLAMAVDAGALQPGRSHFQMPGKHIQATLAG